MSPSEDPEVHSDGSEESDDAEQYKDSTAPKTKTVRSSRACITCRRMKTRCEIDEALGSACKLCIRTRRQCVMQDIPRRRKRKTTERVADLEQKINALTALLASKEAGASTSARSDSESVPPRASEGDTPAASDDTLIADALSRGLLTWETAQEAFGHYQNDMSHYFPFVVFPQTQDAEALRDQQPLLFFAVVSAALSRMRTRVDLQLFDMLIKDLAMRVVYRGERSLELVQTLLVHVCFYARSLQMRDLNFNQMTHIASTMATDIGLGRRPHKSASAQRADPPQLESLAARRAWLGCYFMGSSMSMSLRHPAFVRWSVYTEECLDVLSSEPPALPSDVWLCDLIRLQRIAEAGSAAFSMDDPGAIITLRDVRTQYQLRGFRQQLDYWRRNAKTSLSLPFARHTAACIDIFINEIALHTEHDIDDLRSPLRSSPITALGDITLKFKDLHFIPAREEALFACLAAIHECFDAMLSIELPVACYLPNLFFVRTGYAARGLRKLLNICDSQAEFEGKPHINVQDLKFEEYLTSIIDLFAKVHAENGSTVAGAFALVLKQIKTQGLESSKLLSSASRLDKTASTDSEFEPKSITTMSSTELIESFNHPCLQLGIIPTPSETANTDLGPKAIESVEATAAQPDQVDAFSQPRLLGDVAQWQQNESGDAFMTGLDVLQWFEQDFALHTAPFEYDAYNLQPPTTYWHK